MIDVNKNCRNEWILCKDKLPDWKDDVILFYRDTYHNHPSWPSLAVSPAWLANVGEEETPEGIWAIEGRLGNYVIKLEDGIAWMKLPKAPCYLLEVNDDRQED